jgi:hypothetical protein
MYDGGVRSRAKWRMQAPVGYFSAPPNNGHGALNQDHIVDGFPSAPPPVRHDN